MSETYWRRNHRRIKLIAGALVIGFGLGAGACAPIPKDPVARAEYDKRNDPLEPLNRKVFAFNTYVEKNVLRPVGEAYKETVPPFVRDRIRNFSDNMGEPVTFLNDLLQGKPDRAAETAMRFVFNTTAGMLGFFDAAGQWGLKRHTEDFGQTLAVWGVPEGPYLMLPLLGPSSTRHTAGRVVDYFSDPFGYVTGGSLAVRIIFGAQSGLSFIDIYARNIDALKSVEKNSLDYYSAIRSYYRQNRRREILDGKVKNLPLPGDDEDE